MIKKIGALLVCSVCITAMEKKGIIVSRDTEKEYAWLLRRLPPQYHHLLWFTVSEELDIPFWVTEKNGSVVKDTTRSAIDVMQWYTKFVQHGGIQSSLDDLKSYHQKGDLKGHSFDLSSARVQLGRLLSTFVAQTEGLMAVYSPSSHNIYFYNGTQKLIRGSRTYKKYSERFCDLRVYAEKKYESCGDKETFEQALVGYYKIHIMPQEEDILHVMARIIQALKEDTQLQTLIKIMKIKGALWINNKMRTPTSKNFPQEQYGAAIIIYPSWGKENAQKVLDILLKILKDFKGSDHLPRYNLKVNDLIFYAQGDGDNKMVDTLREAYFDPATNYALYKADITGKKQDYHLKF